MFEVLLIAIGTLFIIFPQWKEKRTKKRLDELRGGASEAYFEEHRSLEAYSPAGKWQTRLLGSVFLAFAVISLVLNHSN
ncbi:hypothetical protein [Novosphingopyxis iocasae]|uniref:hypothetical protein n=1 Tax=Novosphingopyxis iocasae TaxID=2762729 RepID=UPI001651A4D1|nr:hypothetical protein [Novosphingopyxis iocasae]